MSEQGWIGVDLDGTLSLYTKGDYNSFVVGPPIPKMVNRVKQWLREGKNVKIMTARVNPATETPDRLVKVVNIIKDWCIEQFDQELPLTCSKDYHMYALYDDRACQVIPNTGETLEDAIKERDLIISNLRRNQIGIKGS
jgi:hypothetical protein